MPTNFFLEMDKATLSISIESAHGNCVQENVSFKFLPILDVYVYVCSGRA